MALLQKKEASLAPLLKILGKDELLDTVHPIANFEQIPPLTAVCRMACYYCYLPEAGKIFGQKKLNCVRCKAVKYCDAKCQKADWPRHKAICKILKQFETSKLLKQLFVLQLMDGPFEEQEEYDGAVSRLVHMQLDIASQILKRPLSTTERNLISMCRRCNGCGKSDSILRIEAEMNKTPVKTLQECQGCIFAWYCSDDHYDIIKQRHRIEPAPDGYDNLTECTINYDIIRDINYIASMARDNNIYAPVWFSPRPLRVWKALKNSTWDDQILEAIQKEQHALVVDTFKRNATQGLSMPMTILWALDNLNEESVAWTLRQNCVIHIIGAYQYEYAYAKAFEELLHRLPRVKRLKACPIYFIGPEMGELALGTIGKESVEEVCIHCSRAQKKMIHAVWGKTYHELVKSEAHRIGSPDLVVAFNAGLAQDKDKENLWGPTIKILVDKGTPCLFTAYCQEDAEKDVDILQEAGAKIPAGLGPLKNPFGSRQYKKEPRRTGNFYAVNNWVTGTFK